MKSKENQNRTARELMQLHRYRPVLLFCVCVTFAFSPATAVDKDAAVSKSLGLLLLSGQTTGTSFTSDLRGASYANSEVSLSLSGMVSWDRGYDASGIQVWGAKTGGYSFKRVKRL